jgi:Bacterial PH domain
MSYIDQSLGAGEVVIARAHFPWTYVLAAWLALLIPGFALAGFLSWCESQPVPFDKSDPVTWYTALVALLFLWGLLTFLRRMIRKWTTEIGVTSHRFVERYGLFSMRTNEIALPNIEGVRVNQSFVGRIFGYGVVRIEGTGVDAVNTPPIGDPVGFVRAIQTAKEHPSNAR